MLAWIPSAPQSPHAYMPSRPSPLVPQRTPNAVRRQPLAPSTSHNTFNTAFTFNMDMTSKPSAGTPPRRAVKPNPLIQRSTGDAGRERRRDMFLKKVANDRDERRWAGRAQQVEQIMLLDYKKKERRRQEELERSAPAIAEPLEDDEHERDEDAENRDPMLGSSQMTMGVPSVFNNYIRSSPLQTMWSQNSEAEVEAVAQQEDEELDALLAMMEEDEQRVNAAREDGASHHYGSDDDEYDNIFSEYIAAEQTSQPMQQAHEEYMIDDQDDAMDMTVG